MKWANCVRISSGRVRQKPPGLPGWETAKEALADELANVLSYTVRLADVCDIDLAAAFKDWTETAAPTPNPNPASEGL